MNKKRRILLWLGVALIVAAALVFAASFFTGGRNNVELAAAEMGLKVETRLRILDSYIDKGLHADTDE